MSRFSKPRKSFTPSTRVIGNESLERQVLSSNSVRGTSGNSGSWNWKDVYGGNNVYIPIDPIILASHFYTTVYEQVNLFVTEDNIDREYFVLDENGNSEEFLFWTENAIGNEGFYVLDENGEPEEFQTYED
jgi:hypothetical protein